MEEECSNNFPNCEENLHDKVEKDHPSSKVSKMTIKYEDFFEIIKLYPCLFNKSQTPTNKYRALQEIKEKIEKAHGINLNCSQIRKKL